MRILMWIGVMGCSVNAGGIPQYQDVDLMGATFDNKLLNGARACQDWCEERNECVAYTYGGPSVDERYRGRCYLKSAGFRFDVNKGFVSGIKR